MIQHIAATLLALSGGVVALVAGRRIARHCDDPDFSTRHFRHRVLMTRIWAALIVAIGFLAPRAMLWNLPLLYFAVAAGTFPSRKRIYEERWSLGEYLLDRIRLVFFAGTFWLALIAAPGIIAAVGVNWWPAVVLVLALWFASYQEFLAFALRAAPMNADLAKELEPIVAASSAPPPRLFEGGAVNGRFANALALPNGHWSAVLITRAAIQELTRPELVAIFAHELAHVEQFNERSTRWRQILGWFLIPTFAALPLVLAPGDTMTSWWPLIWPFLLMIAMTVVLTQRQKNETLADLRALKLGADPEALISGLEKIHTIARLPRRFDPSIEKRMSHPSLALRITAIRKEAGLEPVAATSLPRWFALRSKRGWARFDAETITVYAGLSGDPVADPLIIDSAATSKSWRVASLTAVHFAQALTGPELRARAGNEKLRLPIRKDDAVAVNEALESAGISITTEAAQTAESPVKRRLVAALAFFVSLLPGISFALTAASLVALITATAPAMAAMGAAAIAAGAFGFFGASMPMIGEIQPLFAALTAVFGLLAVIFAFSTKPEQRERGLVATIVVLAVALAVAAIPFVLAVGDDPVARFFLAAQQRPSVTILLAAMAGALLVSGRRRQLATVAAAAAGCTLLAGLPLVGEKMAGDSLITSREPEWVVNPRPIASHTVAGYAMTVRISPDGRSLAVSTTPNDEDEPARSGTFIVGAIGGATREIEAQAIAFIDGGRIARVRRVSDAQVAVEEVDVTTGSTRGGAVLPSMYNVDLRVEPDGRWTVAGMDVRTQQPVRFSGLSGSTGYETERWNVKSSFMGGTSWGGFDREIVYTHFPAERSSQAGLLGTFGGRAYPTTIWRTAAGKSEKLGKTLLQFVRVVPVPGSDRHLIVASDAKSMHVATWSPAERGIRRHGAIEATGFRIAVGRRARLAVPTSKGEVVVWNLSTGKAMTLPGEGSMSMPLDTALADRAVAVLWMRDGDMVVDVYPTDALD